MRASPNQSSAEGQQAFTLLEMLVASVVLTLLIVLFGSLFNSAMRVTGSSTRHLLADAQAHAILDRMAVDIGQMVKRADVDYFLKDPTRLQVGNDQFAFFSQVAGYYPSAGAQSPLSLVSYRVNAEEGSGNFNKLQRLGYGLVWSGVSATDTPIVFLPLLIADTWKAVPAKPGDADYNDDKYELAGPQVFRMEYCYLLKGRPAIGAKAYPAQLSDTPWDKRIPGHTSISGLRDVAAIKVLVAIIDPKSQVLVTDNMLKGLAGKMPDVPATDEKGDSTSLPGDLETLWQAAIDDPGNGIPGPAAANIRVYSRTFFLPPTQS